MAVPSRGDPPGPTVVSQLLRGIQSQINAALADGSVIPDAADRNYFCCPSSSLYLVRRPVTIAGRHLRQMEQFTFDISAEEMAEGGEFVRRLLSGPFHSTSRVDYCDPAAEGDD